MHTLLPSLLLATAFAAKEPPALCTTDCARPFGDKLGAVDGVIARSNCSAACVDPRPVYHKPTEASEPVYTGIGWQCVEYARRYWLQRYGVVFGSVDTAADMWTAVRSVNTPGSDKVLGVHAQPNGGIVAPAVGDLIIYRTRPARSFLRFGHVAVIVKTGDDTVSIAEQNWSNQPWLGVHTRELTLSKEDARWHMADTTTPPDEGEPLAPEDILGWLQLQKMTD